MPIYGITGSPTFSSTLSGYTGSQISSYPSYIDIMMFYLADNTNSSITAREIRDISLTQWYLANQPSDSSGSKLLGVLKGANMNTTGDNAIILTGGTQFLILDIVLGNPSITLTGITDFAVYSGTARSGNQFLFSGQYNDLPTGNYLSALTVNQMEGPNPLAGNTVYATVGVAVGSAATADIYIYGYIIS